MIKVGSVLKLFVKDTNPPKEKYFFVLGETKDNVSLATFYVNSEVNLNIHRNPVLVKYNILIESSKYPFLKYDSYLDCTKLIVKDKTELHNIVKERPEAIIYKLNSFFLKITTIFDHIIP